MPRSIEGAILSIADKADSIAGMFALGLIPSGSKDPFALRRQANGIVKTIAEHKLPLTVTDVCRMRGSLSGFGGGKEIRANMNFAEPYWHFLRERLEFYLRDVLGYRLRHRQGCSGGEPNDIVDDDRARRSCDRTWFCGLRSGIGGV